MKSIILLSFILIFIVVQSIISQDVVHVNELQVVNRSSYQIKVDIYPIGTVFNGDKKYKLLCKRLLGQPELYIIGVKNSFLDANGGQIQLNHDASDGDIGMSGAIGYGKYRIDFFKWNSINQVWDLKNYCFVDFNHSNYPWGGSTFTNDINIDYYSEDNIEAWEHPLPYDKTIRIWDQHVRNPSAVEEQNKMVLFLRVIIMLYG